jgi:hypothetical protein
MLSWSRMALPYPPEVETGKLQPRERDSRRRFAIDEHVARAIEPVGSELLLFGVTLRPPPGADPLDLAAHFRQALLAHFNERRPDADAATWQLFADQARAQLEQLEQADDHALRVLLLTIDGM